MEAMKYGRFEIRPALRQVWVDHAVSPLGARAFDLLMLLVDRCDRVVSKDEIFDKVWPGVVVEENNLSVQISALRRALGADVITTVTGRGYRFTALLSTELRPNLAAWVAGNLPARTASLYGRDTELSQLLDAYAEAACVTVCGLAGVGKTALANVAAQRLAAQRRYAQGAWRVELTDVRDPAMLTQAICQALGIQLEGRQDPLGECLAHLQHQELLLMLDNCEHIIDAVATLVGQLLAKAGRVHVLATSQEPLRVTGERVMRLNPLAVPVSMDAENAEAYGAVRMLLERVRGAMGGNFEPSPEEFVDLIEICRQLDGIPLALEFAATRVPFLGLAGVRSRLHDRLRLLAGGPRTAPLRHRSLQAALEWSHQLLSPRTQEILHRLAIFPSGFSLLGAQLLLDTGVEADIIEHLNVLVDRSLVTFQAEVHPRYRMLETTRAFALDCLAAENDGVDWQEKHALAMGKVCLLAARERDSSWMWQEMPNARSALAWALAAPGHGETAVTIATYTSVVLGAGGAIREALDNLLGVQHLLADRFPAALTARYWHWLGRLGVEGRLPSSQCVDALQRADNMFTQLGEPRHRHACQRHLAEAELRSGHVDLAEHHLIAARSLEQEKTPPADRMRRVRVEALLAEARNQHGTALRHAQTALTLAEAHGIDRYRLLLMADMAWTHLQMGHADAAVTAFQELLLHLDQSIRQGLARARASSGLTAALVAADRIDEAVRGAGRSVRVLQQANLLRSRCDVFAWVAAAAGNVQTAAQLIGAGEDFCALTETERDPISQLARKRAMDLIYAALSAEDRGYWCAQGANASEAELIYLLEHAFAVMPAAPLNGATAT
jgi:predicted ATPase/DNA-binding winged helix-turn-helix (wHTH) protein